MKTAQILLRRLLEQIGANAEGGFVLVLDCEGLEDLPESISMPAISWTVHRVSTEVRLRYLLWQAGGAPFIAVLPESLARGLQASPDLLRRSIHQRVHALSVNDILEVVLGARVVGAEQPHMQELALQYVEQLSSEMGKRTLPTVVDRRLLTEMLIDVSVGETVRTAAPAALLAAWLTRRPEWTDNVRKLVRDALPALHGDEGRLLSWALDTPAEAEGDRLRALIVHGAVLTVEADELPKAAWGPLWKAAAAPPLALDRRIVRRTVTRLADDTLAVMGDAAAADLLAEANGVARQNVTVGQVMTSRLLPLAFEDRAHAVARKAASGTPIDPTELAWLSQHRAARVHAADLAVIEALARVARWLETVDHAAPPLLQQVNGYLVHGGFADLAVAHLRRALAGSAHHHAEAAKVLDVARARRDEQNRRFAETLATGYEAALHLEGLTPLHRVWKRVVAERWQRDVSARLFVVVLDGCSYPAFLELLRALSADSGFPIGIQPDRDGRVGGMPALAPLPTVTSHARGAIFLGEIPNDPLVAETVFAEQDEARTDKARFTQNHALGARTRRLFLKGDLADGGQALRGALEDMSVEIVAAVFNAVDDQIGSSNTGAVLRITPEDIRAFKPSLATALRAGRQVLVTADHGHTPFVDKSLRVGAGKTPRYVHLQDGEQAPDGFLEIDLKGLGGPPARRAFAWRSGAYLGNPQVGFHGGCSLEEMVVPMAWLVREGLHADEPAWWYGQGSVAAPETPAPIQPPLAAPVPSDELPAPAQQLALFEDDGLALPAHLLQRMQGDEKRALVLLRENGTARASELATRLGKNPVRVNGLMRTLRRTLHTEGITLFTDETLPGGETLYRFTGQDDGAR